MPQLATTVWMGYPLEKGPDRKFGTGDDFVPRMGFCSDPVEWPVAYAERVDACRPVHGIEVTGGSFPATIWNTYMTSATSILDLEFVAFATPVDLPDEVLNSAPPPPPEPSPTKSPPGDKPTPTPTPLPTPSPTPSPEPTPSVEPTPTLP